MFSFAWYNIHSALITTAKSISIAIFRSHVLSCKKREISPAVGYKTPQVKTGDWEWLWRHSVSWQADYYARKWYKSAFYMVAITRKTRKKGISIHQIPIFNDLRSEAFTRYQNAVNTIWTSAIRLNYFSPMVQHSPKTLLAWIYGYARWAQQIASILHGTLQLERVTRWCRDHNSLCEPAKETIV